jgi:hypothetical protein
VPFLKDAVLLFSGFVLVAKLPSPGAKNEEPGPWFDSLILRTSVASDVRHTLVCRDLTDEVYHRDERQTEGSSG